MAGAYSLLLLVFTTLVLAAPQPALEARQDTTDTTSAATCSAAAPSSAEAACISGRGTAFVNSLCSGLTSTAVVYSTAAPRTVTRTSTVSTSYSETRTRISVQPTTIVTTTTYTSTVRVTSTTSSIAGSVTQTIVRTTTQYTCPNSGASTIFPSATSDETSGLKRRQATSTATACFPYFSAQYGLEGIIQACKSLRPSYSIATVTITLPTASGSGTVTVTSSVTATGRSTTRITRTITRTSVITSSIATSTTIRRTIPYISTIRSTRTTTLTSAYPLPTGRFRIFMRVNGAKLYGRNVQAASNTSGTDVIALSTDSSSASSWGFNNLLNLILAGPQTKIAVEQNTWDVPFVYLLPNGLPLPDPWTAPTFAPCNGTLVPTGGESRNIFAACGSGNGPDRRLAFGPPGIWNSNVNNQGDAADAVQNGTCVTGPLGVEAVSGSLVPTQSVDSSTTVTTTSSTTTSSTTEDSSSTTADSTSTSTSTSTSSSSSSTSSSSTSSTSSSSSSTTSSSTTSSTTTSSDSTTTTTSDSTTTISSDPTTTSPTATTTSTPSSDSTTIDLLPTGPVARAPIHD